MTLYVLAQAGLFWYISFSRDDFMAASGLHQKFNRIPSK